MKEIYNYSEYLDFLILRKLTLKNLFENDFKNFKKKYKITQKKLIDKVKKIEKIEKKELKKYGDYYIKIGLNIDVYKNYKLNIESLAYFEYMLKKIKRIKNV